MTPIDQLYDEYNAIANFLADNTQPSLYSDVDRHFKKVIALSSASYFENLILDCLVEFISQESNASERAISFFKKKYT